MHMQKSQAHGLLGLNKNVLTAWLCFAALGIWVYQEIAQKEFTAILTLSAFAQALAFLLLHMQISASRSVTGISGRSLILHVVKLCCRLGTTLWLEGYLPADKSGDWIYQLCDVLS